MAATVNLGTAQVIQGNALNLPLPDSSVDLICTSPPYFGLRSYQDAGTHYQGQLGSEATPAEFLDALLAATREMVRVLKPSGSIFVNLGDKYAGDGRGTRPQGKDGSAAGRKRTDAFAEQGLNNRREAYGTPKSLMGIPWRYAIACIDRLGLILRAEIIWAKPNGLPESVTDRVRRTHETWFHFTRSPRYFSAVDEIREPSTTAATDKRSDPSHYERLLGGRWLPSDADVEIAGNTQKNNKAYNPLGKLPGSVWTVPTQPLTVPPELGVDHFAAYPMEWPRRIITGWTPNGICVVCGEGRRPVVAKEYASTTLASASEKYARAGHEDSTHQNTAMGRIKPQEMPNGRANLTATVTGYTCLCSTNTRAPDANDEGPKRESLSTPTAPTIPAVVLDPFGGTGTTALVAKALGRIGITIDLSADYCRLAEWRCNDPRELAAALQVEKPEPIHPDQLDLFDGEFEPALSPRPSGGLAQSKARGQDCTACGYRMQYAARATCEKCGAAR